MFHASSLSRGWASMDATWKWRRRTLRRNCGSGFTREECDAVYHIGLPNAYPYMGSRQGLIAIKALMDDAHIGMRKKTLSWSQAAMLRRQQ